jgi:hypothetical protein
MGWIYKNKEYTPPTEELDPKKIHGFVYEIENLDTGMKYIGKKSFFRTKYFQKNKKRKRKLVESNWQEYYGSSERLLEDIASDSTDQFQRTILRLCKTKSECSYFEAKYQFERGVLESDEYYNAWIMVKVRRSHLTKL